MSIVCFDTHVLIWGIKEDAEEDQKAKIEEAKYLIQKMQDDDHQVIIPSIALAEFLCGIDPSRRPELINTIYSHFRVIPFDTAAAAIYANMWHQLGKEKRVQIRDEEKITRSVLKADMMIVATALSRDAWCIYSEDGGIKNVSEAIRFEVRDLPALPPKQGEFPFEEK